jgi:hypothetical protein
VKLFFEAGTGFGRAPGIQDDSAPIDYAKQAAEAAAAPADAFGDPFAESPPPADRVRVPPETMPEAESVFGMNGPISIEWAASENPTGWGSLATKLSAPVRIHYR